MDPKPLHTEDFTTHSPEDTYRLGEQIGARLSGGAVLALIGTLGSGKTALVQGLAKGLGVPGDYYITSPTFTLINEYPGRHTLYHVDLYRLVHPDAVEEIGLYDLLHEEGVVAIEWADRLEGIPLGEYLRVQAEIAGDESRTYRLSAYGRDAANMLEGLQKEWSRG